MMIMSNKPSCSTERHVALGEAATAALQFKADELTPDQL